MLKHRIWVALLLIAGVIILGTAGYVVIEDWPIFNSIYMTIITISTVGFSEVGTLTPHGRMLTMVLIVLGIGIGGYTIGNLSAFIIEGHIRHVIRGRKMERQILNLKNHTIVCGFGRTGNEIVNVLNADNVDFVIIDSDDARVAEAQDEGFLAIQGNATDDDVLRKCRIEHASGLIAALGNDADNLFVVLSAREMNPNLKIISRGIDETSTRKLLRAGADNVISPFTIAGRRMAALVTRPEIVEFLEIMVHDSEFELKMEQIIIKKKSLLIAKKLNQSNIKSETDGAMVIGIKKQSVGKMVINPPGDTTLEEGDILIALGNDMQLEKLEQLAGRKPLLDIGSD